MSEKYGTVIVDGKILDLDKTSINELEKIEEKLKNDIVKIRSEIDELLK